MTDLSVRIVYWTVALLLMTSPFPVHAVDFDRERNISNEYKKPAAKLSWGEMFRQWFSREGFNKSYAIIIGISDYSDGWTQLRAVHKDAERVREFLIHQAGFDHVVTLTNKAVTKGRIEDYMEDVFPGLVGKNDRFLFYYSGHGTQRRLGNRTRGYLPLIASGRKRYSSMISMDDIEKWNVNLYRARHQLYLLDACFSGLAGNEVKSDSALRKKFLADLMKPSSYLLTAGTGGEKSVASEKKWGGSLFTHAFLRGSSGKADSATQEFPPDGVVSVRELHDYIKKFVAREKLQDGSIEQTVQWSDLGKDSDGEFFFITKDQKDKTVEKQIVRGYQYGEPVTIKGYADPGLYLIADQVAGEKIRAEMLDESEPGGDGDGSFPTNFDKHIGNGACFWRDVEAGSKLEWSDIASCS